MEIGSSHLDMCSQQWGEVVVLGDNAHRAEVEPREVGHQGQRGNNQLFCLDHSNHVFIYTKAWYIMNFL